MIKNLSRKLQVWSAKLADRYRWQGHYVSFMMRLVAELMSACSKVDPVIKADVAKLPDGFLFKMQTNPGKPCMLLQKRGGVLQVVQTDRLKPDLLIHYKHISHAFLAFAFQENTAVSLAHDRLLIDGDPKAAMQIVRSLNRVLCVMLPKVLASRSVKTYPEFARFEKLLLALKTSDKLLQKGLRGLSL